MHKAGVGHLTDVVEEEEIIKKSQVPHLDLMMLPKSGATTATSTVIFNMNVSQC